MPTEILIPFAVTPGGSIATETDPQAQLQHRVRALIATLPHERVMDADYGVNTTRYLFDAKDTAVTGILTQQITAALRAYEPQAVIQAVRPITSAGTDGYGLTDIEVDVVRADVHGNGIDAKPVSVIRIGPGGTVYDLLAPTTGS
jgi:phage baseplate assembly protein W